MLKILGRSSSSNVQKVVWLCGELEIPFERIDIGGPFGGNDQPEYLSLNPNGVVPTIDDEGFILDGFPRNPNQASELEKILIGKSRDLDKVIHIDVSEPELMRRLGGRFVCRACQAPHSIEVGEEDKVCEKCGGDLYQRTDDASAAVQKRIEVYNSETTPVLRFYLERGLLSEISGDNTVDEVNNQIISALGA